MSHRQDKGGDEEKEEKKEDQPQKTSSAATGVQRWTSALIQDSTHTHTLDLELMTLSCWQEGREEKGGRKVNSGGRDAGGR